MCCQVWPSGWLDRLLPFVPHYPHYANVRSLGTRPWPKVRGEAAKIAQVLRIECRFSPLFSLN